MAFEKCSEEVRGEPCRYLGEECFRQRGNLAKAVRQDLPIMVRGQHRAQPCE